MAQYTWRAGKVRKLKDGVDIGEYFTIHPDAIKICNPPSPATMDSHEGRLQYVERTLSDGSKVYDILLSGKVTIKCESQQAARELFWMLAKLEYDILPVD